MRPRETTRKEQEGKENRKVSDKPPEKEKKERIYVERRMESSRGDPVVRSIDVKPRVDAAGMERGLSAQDKECRREIRKGRFADRQ